MADNDILIQIETAYKSGGLEAAKKAITDAEKSAASYAQTTQKVEQSTAGANRELNNAQRALGGLNSAASASTGSFRGLSQVLELFGSKLASIAAKFTLLAGAFSAGHMIGSALDKWFKISEKIADLYAGRMQQVGSIQSRLTDDIKKLDTVTLDRLKTQFNEITQTLSESNSALSEFIARTSEIAATAHENTLSRIEAEMPAGSDRDAAIAEENARYGLRRNMLRRTQEEQTAQNAQTAIRTADDAIAEQIKAQIRAQSAMRDATTPEEAATARLQYAAATAGIATAQEKAKEIRAKQEPVITAAQERLQIYRPGGTADQTVLNKYQSALMPVREAISEKNYVEGMLNTELASVIPAARASAGEIPKGAIEHAQSQEEHLRALLSEVQKKNSDIIGKLVEVFDKEALNKDTLMNAIENLSTKIERTKGVIKNLPQ